MSISIDSNSNPLCAPHLVGKEYLTPIDLHLRAAGGINRLLYAALILELHGTLSNRQISCLHIGMTQKLLTPRHDCVV